MIRHIVYILTPILAILLRKYELVLSVILMGFLLLVLAKRPFAVQILALLIGASMATLEYICIRFGMWKYFNSHMTIPIWLPIIWTLVTLFIGDVLRVYGGLRIPAN
jgi:hypothetical protein